MQAIPYVHEEVIVDFTVAEPESGTKRFYLVACESEMFDGHGTNYSLDRKQHGYTYDFWKLLLFPAPILLFAARVAPSRTLKTIEERLDNLENSLIACAGDYHRYWLGRRLYAVLLPLRSRKAGSSSLGRWPGRRRHRLRAFIGPISLRLGHAAIARVRSRVAPVTDSDRGSPNTSRSSFWRTTPRRYVPPQSRVVNWRVPPMTTFCNRFNIRNAAEFAAFRTAKPQHLHGFVLPAERFAQSIKNLVHMHAHIVRVVHRLPETR